MPPKHNYDNNTEVIDTPCLATLDPSVDLETLEERLALIGSQGLWDLPGVWMALSLIPLLWAPQELPRSWFHGPSTDRVSSASGIPQNIFIFVAASIHICMYTHTFAFLYVIHTHIYIYI